MKRGRGRAREDSGKSTSYKCDKVKVDFLSGQETESKKEVENSRCLYKQLQVR